MDRNNWRIGLTEGALTLGSFIYYGIDIPDTALFKEFQEAQPFSLGKMGAAGYESFTFGWNNLSPIQLGTLIRIIGQARGSQESLLFMTIPLATGRRTTNDWRNVSARVYPISIPGRTSPKGHGLLISNVEITLMNVEIIDAFD